MNQSKLESKLELELELELELDLKLEITSLLIDIHIDTKANINTSFEFVSITLISKAIKNTYRASAIKKNTFVFRRLEKIAIKNCKKKNAIPILFTLASKHQKISILVTKDNYVFNIAKTITIESIKIILETQNSKKAKFELKKSNFVIKKQKAQ